MTDCDPGYKNEGRVKTAQQAGDTMVRYCPEHGKVIFVWTPPYGWVCLKCSAS